MFPTQYESVADQESELVGIDFDSSQSVGDRVRGFIRPSEDAPLVAGNRKVWHICNQYKTSGRFYWRYQWGRGAEVKQTIHIPGGSVANPIARARAQQVQYAIAEGQSVQAIKQVIRSWPRRK